jgi:hypothetical protein
MSYLTLLATHLFGAALYAQVAAAGVPTESEADKAYTQHEWAIAESQYKLLTEKDPANARFWFRLGVCSRADKHYESALEAFQQVKARSAGKGLPAFIPDYEIAETYAAKGDAPHAFDSLNASAQAGFSQPDRLANDAEWNELRGDPKFATLLAVVQRNAAPCDQAEFHQFDFWLGDWDVFSAAGGPQRGTSHIASEMGACVVWENWTSSVSGYFGKSYNTYNVNLHRWEQYWVDNSAGTIFFYGNLKDGVMDYWTDDVPQPDGQKLRRHLQFFPLSEGRVRQFSQGSVDGGKTWNVEYDFIYQKRAGSLSNASK